MVRVEKYRPNTLEDVSGHQDILATINKFVESNVSQLEIEQECTRLIDIQRLPHLLLYGPPGTGKTSTILALARRIYGPKNMRQMVLELNASDDRGIEVVREQIKTFASMSPLLANPFSHDCLPSRSLGSATYCPTNSPQAPNRSSPPYPQTHPQPKVWRPTNSSSSTKPTP